MNLFHLKPYILYLFKILGDKEVNYNYFNDLNSNKDDQGGHECPPSVFCKETGSLIYLSHFKPYICYTFGTLGGKGCEL